MVVHIALYGAMRNNEYPTGGIYPCLMIQTNRNSQIRDSNPSSLLMGSLNLHMDSLDSPSSLRTNNNGDSNPSSLLMGSLNLHMDNPDNPSSLRTNNNGDSNLLRITLRHSM